MIKIDIEGAELPCLQGAEKTLRQFMPAIVVEIQEFSAMQAGYQAKDILRYLKTLCYEFWTSGEDGGLSPLCEASLKHYQNVLCLPHAGNDVV